jgi:hypothetical protein
MAYDVTLVEFQTPGVGGISNPSTFCGFPSGSFNYLLTSFWVCLPYDGAFGTNFTVQWDFFSAHPQSIAQAVDIVLKHNGTTFYSASFPSSFRSLRSHILISVDCPGQHVQVYVNDVAVTASSGGFTSVSSLATAGGVHILDGAGTASGHGSSIADVWSASTPAFVDLSIVANRRKFIHADLTPVDPGATGTGPIGTQPPVWLTVPSGGVPADLRTNFGTGGAFSNTFSTLTLAFQAPGVCTLPPPPPPPPVTLSMDDVVATAEAGLSSNLISLRWSDDRGHSYGNYVSQSMGDIGEYRTSLQWQRLAYARDRVWEISWSVPVGAALQGCWVDVTPAQS